MRSILWNSYSPEAVVGATEPPAVGLDDLGDPAVDGLPDAAMLEGTVGAADVPEMMKAGR